MKVHAFQIYGDNLGECQKFCELLVTYGEETGLMFQKYIGHIDRPVYLFKYEELNIGLMPCGRYKDWNMYRRPYIGYEDPDIIVCHAREPKKVGKPILGIEFNDAIEAGNNAWQRLPRIAQAGEKGVAFIYSIPICDAEVKEGEIKSFRHPNAIIQIAQLILMAEYKTISLTTFTNSPWYDTALAKRKVCPHVSWKDGERNLAQISSSLIIESTEGNLDFRHLSLREKSLKESFNRAIENMLCHISYFIPEDFTLLKGHPAFEEANRQDVIGAWWRSITGEGEIPSHYGFYDWNIEDFENIQLPFQKVTGTRSIYEKELNKLLSSGKKAKERIVALSYKKGANEIAFIYNPKYFAELLQKVYPSLENEVISHLLKSEDPLVFLPIAGYVMDTGGPSFSRPDKGLVGLMRVIFGRRPFSRRVVLIYNQLVPADWKRQISEAKAEGPDLKSSQTNNLWREIVRFATAVIVDKYGSGVLI